MARIKLRDTNGSRDQERDFNSWFVQRQKAPEPTPSPTFNPHGEGTYLAPESLAAIRSMKASSDVWSLGCVISVLFVYLENGADGVVQYREERRAALVFTHACVVWKNKSTQSSDSRCCFFGPRFLVGSLSTVDRRAGDAQLH